MYSVCREMKWCGVMCGLKVAAGRISYRACMRKTESMYTLAYMLRLLPNCCQIACMPTSSNSFSFLFFFSPSASSSFQYAEDCLSRRALVRPWKHYPLCLVYTSTIMCYHRRSKSNYNWWSFHSFISACIFMLSSFLNF